ncbi:cytochrome P450 [Nonomuraea sp. NPDC005501]|uniref:cytochrome P450 n=1 Tax=Nonomuraea sp. NPDC005501 TaxID=3156884 RepID=UPI0033A693ED
MSTLESPSREQEPPTRCPRTGAEVSASPVLGVDDTPALRLNPYTFIAERAGELGTDVFDTRLLLRPTTCMTGAEAAKVFYDERRFVRHGAAPRRLLLTLFGRGGVQSLDGGAHRSRKAMFMSLMTPEARERLRGLAEAAWGERIERWARRPSVTLFDEVSELLCEVACAWTGVRLDRRSIPHATARLLAMIDAPAAAGPRYLRGRTARIRAEKAIAELVKRVRERPERFAGTALETVALHRDPDGALLDPRVAAVEVLNLLRPIVAVGRFVTFAALALHANPDCRERLRSGDDAYLEYFVQEVRRFYPFFPMVAAKVAEPFEWRGHRFPKGRRVLLDLHGIDHDPRLWDRPDEFHPERFAEWDGGAFDFVPQGGGDPYGGHRCPGEWITIDLMKVAVTALTRRMSYGVVPEQDLSIPRWRAPALPVSGFVIDRVIPGEPAE